MKLIRDNARCCVERLHRFRSIHSLRCVDGDVRGVGGSERTPTAEGVQRDRRPRRSGELGRHYRRSGHGGRGRLLVPAGRVRPHPLATPLQFGPVPANGPPPRQSKDDAKMAAVCAPQADWFFYCSFFLFGRRQTILKVNVAFIFFLLMATFVAVNIVDAYDVWYRRSSPCVAGNSAISFHFGSF